MRQVLSNNRGFTLIELMVVVAIIGILTAIAIPRFQQATDLARGAKIEADLRAIDTAIVMAEAVGVQNPTLNNNAATGLIPAFLTTTPNPPVGTVRFAAGGTGAVTAGTIYGIANGRATILPGGAAGNNRTVEWLVIQTSNVTF